MTNSGDAHELYLLSGELEHTKRSARRTALDASAHRGSTRTHPHTRHVRSSIRSCGAASSLSHESAGCDGGAVGRHTHSM
jgi:hypothetical protein